MMARLTLELPPRFAFSTELEVQVGHINYGGHLGNDAMLSLVHEARIRFLDRLGFAENDVGGVGLLMVDALVIYRAEVFHGDTLAIEVAVGDVSRSGCDFLYRVTSRESGREAARAKTGVVFFDYDKRRISRVPPVFTEALDALGAGGE